MIKTIDDQIALLWLYLQQDIGANELLTTRKQRNSIDYADFPERSVLSTYQFEENEKGGKHIVKCCNFEGTSVSSNYTQVTFTARAKKVEKGKIVFKRNKEEKLDVQQIFLPEIKDMFLAQRNGIWW